MGFFLHRFGVFSTPFGVEKTPKAAQEKMTTGKAQHAKTFLKELHCSGKEGFFSTPLWGFYYTIYGFFSTPLWGFFDTKNSKIGSKKPHILLKKNLRCTPSAISF